MKRLNVFFCTICIISLASCDPPQEGQKLTLPKDQLDTKLVEEFQDLSTEFQEMAKPNQVQAWVDKLIVKAQPGQDMPEVGKMKEGEIATYLKQRTVRKSEINLRGQRYYEPWILIQREDGTLGWVHQGGVKFVAPDFLTMLEKPKEQVQTRGLEKKAQPDESVNVMIPGKKVGNITLKTTEEDIIRAFGPGQVSRGTVLASATNTEVCTIVMGNTRDELRITWKDETHTEIKAVYVMYPDGKWFTNQGIRVGMDLLELTKINKSPVNFYGFNWEYSGTIVGWRNGAVEKYEKLFYVVLAPKNPQQVSPLLSKFQGEAVYSSNTEGVDQLDLIVSRIVVYLD